VNIGNQKNANKNNFWQIFEIVFGNLVETFVVILFYKMEQPVGFCLLQN